MLHFFTVGVLNDSHFIYFSREGKQAYFQHDTFTSYHKYWLWKSAKSKLKSLLFLMIKNCCSWSVVLVSKGILEEYDFLVVLPDNKTCVGFNYLTLTFKNLQKLF